MAYKIEFTNSAAKELQSFENKIKHRVTVAIDALRENPRPKEVRKLRGHECLYRIRVGSYRIVLKLMTNQNQSE
ncbi:MAG: type II toxin-antitoxin system RelE/ParE family toxin [Methanosarcinaceae archaeon]|nr:type II toxin-antitoxin system RelE/ParE family toxin [Methanosarcinaceae archaeon]